MSQSIQTFMDYAKKQNPNEPEFIQAVEEVAESIIPFIEKNPQYQNKMLLERMIEPERVFSFRVCWLDDNGDIQVNRGYRVQMNSMLGPYKGGLRFHPTVNLSVLKFLAFEQVFKNSLTTLPMGGGKGGANFNPKGKSDNEIMKFCQSFMSELSKYIGPNIDVPAGDIGVGAREIGFLFGQYKRLRDDFSGVITGKGINWGGSLIRPEATGYGLVYFTQNMLETKSTNLKDKKVIISGSGNVAQFACEKCIELGAKVLSMSDSSGHIFVKNGISTEMLNHIMFLKNEKRARISEFTEKYSSESEFIKGSTPWGLDADIALPCATQNEIKIEDAKKLIDNKIICVSEGSNMSTTPEAMEFFQKNNILFSPGKASNAGGVATSGLEMTQNSLRYSWSREEVDERLKGIMKDIHSQCVMYGKNEDGSIDYVLGANIGGFVKVADSMIDQGVV